MLSLSFISLEITQQVAIFCLSLNREHLQQLSFMLDFLWNVSPLRVGSTFATRTVSEAVSSLFNLCTGIRGSTCMKKVFASIRSGIEQKLYKFPKKLDIPQNTSVDIA